MGERAMTPAEKMRAYRARKAAKEFGNQPPVTKSGKAAQIDPATFANAIAPLAARIRELEASNAELAAELDRERGRAKMFEEGLKNAQRQMRAGSTPKAAKPPLPPDEARDRRIKALTTQVRNLRQEIGHLIGAPKFTTIRMSAPLVREMRSALHPDRAAGDAKRQRRLEQLSQEFNSFTFVDEAKI
jgi:predicted RNase H-like nuclease (RuvC/YqgF family)